MADAKLGQEYEYHVPHSITLHYNYNDIGTPFYSATHVPACIVTHAVNTKITDFDSGTTCTIDVGFDYDDGTSDVGDAIVDGANLLSAVQQGSLALTMEDSAGALTNTAARIKVTLAETGTAATAGEGYITIFYRPLSQIDSRTPVYA